MSDTRAIQGIVMLAFSLLAGTACETAGRTSDEDRMDPLQVAAFTEMLRAVNAGDARGYAAVYAEDAVITIHGSGVLAGRGAIEQHEVELLREFPGARLAFYDVWQAGAAAVAHYAVDCPTRAGGKVGHEGLLFYRFEPSGLIAEEHRYLDSLTPMAQMGALGPIAVRPPPELARALRTHVARGSPEEEANVATVRAIFAALDARDAPAFLARVADDVVVDELMLPQPFVGRAGAQAWLETWSLSVPDARTELTTLLAVGEFVLVEGIVRGTLKHPLAPSPATSERFTAHRAAIVRLRGGALTRFASFLNGRELAQSRGR